MHLMRNASESLAGRVGIVKLMGLSQAESAGRESSPFVTDPVSLSRRRKQVESRTLDEVFALIRKGGMPILHSGDEAPGAEQFYSSYMQTYLQRDIKDLTQVGDELAFVRFLTAAAARTGRMLQYADLAREYSTDGTGHGDPFRLRAHAHRQAELAGARVDALNSRNGREQCH